MKDPSAANEVTPLVPQKKDGKPTLAESPAVSIWVLVVLGSLANALNQGDRVIMPITMVPMLKEFGWTKMQEGVILSAFAYGYIVMQMPGGYIATQFQPVRVLCVAVVIWSTCTACTPMAARLGAQGVHDSISGLVTCRIFMGLAEGLCLPAIYQVFGKEVPSAARSRAFGLLLSLGCLGQVIALFVTPFLDPWDSAFYWFGGAGLLWVFVAVTYLPLRGMTFTDAEERDLEGPGEGRDPKASTVVRPAPLSWWSLATCIPMWAIVVPNVAYNWNAYLMMSWLPTYLNQELGVPKRSLYVTAFPYIMCAVGGLVFSYAADALVLHKKCSVLCVRRMATATALLVPALCLVLFLRTWHPTVAIVILCISSFFSGAAACGYSSNHGDISNNAGLTFAISNTIATIPGITAGPLTAWLTEHGSWSLVFYIAALINVGGALWYACLSKAHKVL
jgi:MFS family permease